MKTRHLIMLAVIAGLTTMIILAGCRKKEEPAPPPQAPTMQEMQKHAEEMKEIATKAAEEVKETAKEAVVEIEQTICPVMEGKIDKAIFTEYQGKKVYFCCPGCKEKFEAEPEKYIAKLPQFSK